MTAFMVTPDFTSMPAGSSPTNARRIFSDESKLLGIVPGSELALYRVGARTSTGFDGAVGVTGANDPISERPAFPDALAGFWFALSEKGLHALAAVQRSHRCDIPP
jgi:hypothetical protein